MKEKNAKSARARQQYYAKHRAHCCADMRRRYDLAQPKSDVQYKSINKVSKNVISNKKIISLVKNILNKRRNA